MTYTPDLPAAARRHLEAADALEHKRRDVAGYLYGIAAECAVKAMLLDAGRRPLAPEARRDDPHYMHFPELRTALRDAPLGRKDQVWRRYIDDPSFMHHWDTAMRYSKGSEIQESWVDAWRRQAHGAVAGIGT